jgi:uncharacterized protein YcbK (DUF882 family)
MCNLLARWLVPVRSARTIPTLRKALRAGCCASVAALVLVFGGQSLQNATANGDTRTITFHHIHLNEDTTITFKVNGRYVPEAMQKVNHALRDWRTSQPTDMDPHLIDVLWEVYREVGATAPIHVIGGYRSPATNAMLRRRSSGVAKFSQHMRGHAVDFYIPGVPLEAIREAGLRLQRGGVGFYPSSGAPFVHLDTGSVRHWPRIPEAQLARILAKGPRTQFAKTTNTKSRPAVVAARNVRDEDEDAEVARPATRARVARAAAPTAWPEPPTPAVIAAAIPLPKSRPAAAPEPTAAAPAGGFNLASASSEVVSEPIRPRPAQASSVMAQSNASANAIINERGYWQGLVEDTPRPPADIPEARVASAEPPVTGSVARGALTPWPMPDRRPAGETLAYAPANEAVDARSTPKAHYVAKAPNARTGSPVLVRAGNRPAAKATAHVRVGERFNNPWMRAMIVAPSALDFMSTSLYGAPDMASVREHMVKPTSTVMMTFSPDPYLGMTADQFRGNAVVFVATVTFRQRTAALQ